MELNRKSAGNILLISAMAILIGLSGILWYSNHQTDKNLRTEKIRQDSILATKLLLDKEIDDLSAEISTLKGKNVRLDSALNHTENIVKEKAILIDKMKAENQNYHSLKKEFRELKKLHATIEKQVKDLMAENENLKAENIHLKSELANMKKPIPMAADKPVTTNFRIELQRNNTKLTVKSRRIRNINVQFDLVNNTGTTLTETFYIVAKDANGKVIAPIESPVQVKDQLLDYSAKQILELTDKNRRINVNIKPSSRIKEKGVIKIEIYSQSGGLIGLSEARTN